ncbi:MAG: hypothetical protein ABSG84_05825 [Acidobacteriaceae bacterium]
MRIYRLLLFFAFVSIGLHRLGAAQTQDPKQIYAQIKQPSTIHWCLPVAGDDPSGTIGNQCARYSECLGALGLQDDVDRPPFSGLSDTQVGWVRRCHQGLYDAAHSNPQIKGAAATQDWLLHHVYPGTEAKPTAAPPPPR